MRSANEPDDPAGEAEALEYGRWLFAQACAFVLGAAELGQVPETALPEVAFAGRSNVGKSSLVNALTGRRTLARISNSPGRTQQLNFFVLGDRLMLADLPGFGYARAPKGLVKRWTRLIEAYLRGRPQLRRVLLLVDSRHGLKDADLAAVAMMDAAAVSYQVVLTKCDKIDAEETRARLEALARELASHPAAHPAVLVTSARTGLGIAEARAALARIAGGWRGDDNWDRLAAP